jgi:hypothetical protein
MCLEVHLVFGVLLEDFSFNRFVGQREARPANLDILVISYHDGLWALHICRLDNCELACCLMFSLLYIRVILVGT